jgi:hypothetical protein
MSLARTRERELEELNNNKYDFLACVRASDIGDIPLIWGLALFWLSDIR